jgi:hypothetical protein
MKPFNVLVAIAYELLVPADDSLRSPVGPLKDLAEKGFGR